MMFRLPISIACASNDYREIMSKKDANNRASLKICAQKFFYENEGDNNKANYSTSVNIHKPLHTIVLNYYISPFTHVLASTKEFSLVISYTMTAALARL